MGIIIWKLAQSYVTSIEHQTEFYRGSKFILLNGFSSFLKGLVFFVVFRFVAFFFCCFFLRIAYLFHHTVFFRYFISFAHRNESFFIIFFPRMAPSPISFFMADRIFSTGCALSTYRIMLRRVASHQTASFHSPHFFPFMHSTHHIAPQRTIAPTKRLIYSIPAALIRRIDPPHHSFPPIAVSRHLHILRLLH